MLKEPAMFKSLSYSSEFVSIRQPFVLSTDNASFKAKNIRAGSPDLFMSMSTHDTMNYSDAPAKLDELQTSHGFLKCRKNSRAKLVPSPRAYARNGALRRWLGDK